MTLTSMAIGGLLASNHPRFNLALFALAAVGSVIAHAANNMINDHFDLSSGLDTESYPRALYAPHPVLSGLVSRRELRTGILIANGLDAAIMIVLAVTQSPAIVWFALAGLFLSVFYVAPPLRLKSRGLGEPSVFLIWGPVMVGGTYFASTGDLSVEVLWASVPYALLVTSVLMGKHLDKMPWDVRENVRTLPALLGEGAARRTTLLLMVAFYVSVIALAATGIITWWCLLVLGALPACARTWSTFSKPKPDSPPEGYPLWPLWFVSWAFRHARRAGALLVVGLFIGAVT